MTPPRCAFSFVSLLLVVLGLGKGTDTSSSQVGGLGRLDSVRVLMGHEGPVTAVRFAPDGHALASAGWDGTIRVWDVGTGETVRMLQGHSGEVFAIAYSPDGRLLASSGNDGQVIVWEVATGQPVRMWTLPTYAITIDFSPDGVVAAGDQAGIVHRLDPATGAMTTLLEAAYPIYVLAYAPDRRVLATAGPINLWDAETGASLVQPRAPGGVFGLAFAPDGTRLASAHWRGAAYLWDAVTGERLQAYEPDTTLRVLSPTGSAEATVRMPLAALAYAPDGAHVAIGGADKRIHVWATATGRAVRLFNGHTKSVVALAYAPDGQWLASGSLDGTIRLWPLADLDD